MLESFGSTFDHAPEAFMLVYIFVTFLHNIIRRDILASFPFHLLVLDKASEFSADGTEECIENISHEIIVSSAILNDKVVIFFDQGE